MLLYSVTVTVQRNFKVISSHDDMMANASCMATSATCWCMWAYVFSGVCRIWKQKKNISPLMDLPNLLSVFCKFSMMNDPTGVYYFFLCVLVRWVICVSKQGSDTYQPVGSACLWLRQKLKEKQMYKHGVRQNGIAKRHIAALLRILKNSTENFSSLGNGVLKSCYKFHSISTKIYILPSAGEGAEYFGSLCCILKHNIPAASINNE